MNWEFLIYAGLLVLSNLASCYLGAKIARGERLLSPVGKDIVLESEDGELEDRYGDIFPLDKVPLEDEEDDTNRSY
jgi:hypothetical protein